MICTQGSINVIAAGLDSQSRWQAVVTVLNAIHEDDFLGFSHGFRPGRSQHDALDALTVALKGQKVNWILDADITSFFDEIDYKWMLMLLGHRIADRRPARAYLQMVQSRCYGGWP
ncbi:reverse transcriptase domain-containing protein [Pseudomonas synxantha]|uniref:reverse transcriptase domain-containing protein n=1 Tax=Pseudomonas synxantha TaxID=47883 RepID=UPI001EFF28A8|nr:reverse transcriptase domain-containing protein [Pseudomonas synxantha]